MRSTPLSAVVLTAATATVNQITPAKDITTSPKASIEGSKGQKRKTLPSKGHTRTLRQSSPLGCFILRIKTSSPRFTQMFCGSPHFEWMKIKKVQEATIDEEGIRMVYVCLAREKKLRVGQWDKAVVAYNARVLPCSHIGWVDDAEGKHILTTRNGKLLTHSPAYKRILLADSPDDVWWSLDNDWSDSPTESSAAVLESDTWTGGDVNSGYAEGMAVARGKKARLEAKLVTLRVDQARTKEAIREASTALPQIEKRIGNVTIELAATEAEISRLARMLEPSHAEKSARKRSRLSEEVEPPLAGVYVLKNPQHNIYYVGKSDNVRARIGEHLAGTGAVCTREFGPTSVRVSPLTKGSTADLEAWERDETLELMYVHGIDKVRGWVFASSWAKLNQVEHEMAWRQICARKDLCYMCGEKGHFGTQCKGGRKHHCYYN